MKCEKFEKLISDALDDEISPKNRKKLTLHLGKCLSCLSYQEHLQRIHREAHGLEKAAISSQYWEDFSARFERKLTASNLDEPIVQPARLRWKWAWAGAPLLAAAALLIVLSVRRGPTPEDYIFSSEAFLHSLDEEIGDNTQLEDLYGTIIVSSFTEGLMAEDVSGRVFLQDDPFFWESLNEDELRFIEQEIKKEMKS